MKLFVTILLIVCTLIEVCEAPQCQCDDLRKEYSELKRVVYDMKVEFTREMYNMKEELQRFKSRDKHERICRKNRHRKCLTDYTQLGHRCYRIFYKQMKTMKEAKRFCRKDNGAHLVAFNKMTEMERLFRHIKNYPNHISNMMFHTSGVLEDPLRTPGTGESKWVWKPWNKAKKLITRIEPIPDESNSTTSIEQCLVFKIERGGILIPGDCQARRPFICELSQCRRN